MERPFLIALAFPELGKETLASFDQELGKGTTKPDLILFPEAFETIPAPATPFQAGKLDPIPDALRPIVETYRAFAVRHDAAVHFGVEIEGAASAKKWAGNQFSLFITPDGQPPVLYHKHTTSDQVAWNDPGWSPERNFPVVAFRGEKIGFTICHDLMLSPLARALAVQGATLWVNPSGENTRDYIWGDLLQARAAENGFKAALCTLNRNAATSNPQRAPHAFAAEGPIALRDLASGAPLETIPFAERTGRLFFFDATRPEVAPRPRTGEAFEGKALHAKAAFDLDRGLLSGRRAYAFHTVSADDFLHRPEGLWAITEKEAPGTVPAFRVAVKDRAEWDRLRPEIEKVVRGRCIEFSTLFAVADDRQVYLAAHRSSNYKDSRVLLEPGRSFPFDDRYLFGPQSTVEIVRGDPRADAQEHGFHDRLAALIEFSGKRGGSLPSLEKIDYFSKSRQK